MSVKGLLTCISLMVLSLFVNAQLPHWAALPNPSDFARQPYNFVRNFYADPEDGSLYMSGHIRKTSAYEAIVLKWNGKEMNVLSASGQTITGPMIKYKGKLYVGGGGLTRFDGKKWEKIDSTPYPEINCFLIYQGKLLVGGKFSTIAGQKITTAALFDGEKWSSLYRLDTVIDGDWAIYGAAEYKGELYLSGNFNPEGKPDFSEIIRFDGKNWKPVGKGIQAGGLGEAGKMYVWRNELYVGGIFLEQDGAPGNSIARWDGKEWHHLGGGLEPEGNSSGTNCAFDMVGYNDRLYVVGEFKYAGNIACSYFACWDGVKWCSLGDSIDRSVLTIAAYQDRLYLGGNFMQINGDTAFARFACWTGKDYIYECSNPDLDTPVSVFGIYPNPATEYIYINLRGAVQATITNVIGQKVLQASEPAIPGGIDIKHFAAGIYVIQVRDRQDKIYTEKFLKL